MPPTIIRSAPQLGKYTPLLTHQSQTPTSFSTPILHYRKETCKLILTANQTSLFSILSDKFASIGGQGVGTSDEEVAVDGIDLWVTSENLILYNTLLSVGVELPYSSITLHAIQRISQWKGIYMQVALSPATPQTTNDDVCDDDCMVELTVIPLPNDEECTDIFFKALSDCANLNPDTNGGSSSDEMEEPIMASGYGGAMLEGFPGEGGWITAENVENFQSDDAEGGDYTSDTLGPGAGTIRLRGEEESELNGGGDDTKWRRTE